MERLELLYEGKAKQVYRTSDPDLLIQHFKDDATAFNAKKRGTIVDKGVLNNRMSEVLFRERMVGVVRTDHPIKKPTLTQLCRYPHVSVSRRGRTKGPLDVALQAVGLQRHVGAVVPFYAAAAALVASTDYIGLVPQRLAEEQHKVLSPARGIILPTPTGARAGELPTYLRHEKPPLVRGISEFVPHWTLMASLHPTQ